jgi:hypothetical protein
MTLQQRIAELVVSVRQKLNLMTPRLLPDGGSDGQVLVKKTDADFDTEWSDIGAWPPVLAVGTGVSQQIVLPEVCTTQDVMVFVKGIFQHGGYTISDNILITTQPAGFEIIIVRYGAGVRGEAGQDGTATIDSVLGLSLALEGKADTNHTHEMSDITGLQEELNALADAIQEDNGIATYEWVAPASTSSWLIEHDLGRYPTVTCVDSAGTQFFGTVTYLDINTLRVDFAYATGGKAYLV